MPTYRIFYSERGSKVGSVTAHVYGRTEEHADKTEWEETVEAKNAAGALDEFFKEHAPHAEGVHIVEETGEPRPLEGLEPFDPDRTYIWVEDSPEHGPRMMQYEGLEEATPGMVTCPLCEGAGEVDEELAEEFLEEWGEEAEEDDETP